MVVTSMPSASRHCETIWPKRPKPITSTDPRASLKSSGSRSAGRASRRSAASVAAATSGPSSIVIAAMAVSRLSWRWSSTPSAAPSGISTKANSPAAVSTEPARSASPRRTQVARNSSHTIAALSTVSMTAAMRISQKSARTTRMSMLMPMPMKNSASRRPRNGSMSASSSCR